MLKVEKLRCEYSQSLLGTDEFCPRFSWIINADGKNILQKAMHIQVSTGSDFKSTTMDTGWLSSNQSIHLEYSGEILKPSTRYFYRVRIRDNREEESPWSKPSWFETGLMTNKNWQAEFISPTGENNPEKSQAWILKKEFSINKKISSARIYATALGLYELYLNSKKIGENTMSPGWTNYNKRLLYQTYDVTPLVLPGSNSLECGLGCGWYKGDLASWLGLRNVYGNRNALSLNLLLCDEEGEKEWILTDEDWKSRPSPVRYSEIYHGEIYDGNLEKVHQKGTQWTGVDIIEQDKSIICAQDGPLTTHQEVLHVKKVITTPSGAIILDFGQNLTGRIRFKVRGDSGDRVILKHAEVLDSRGEFYTENLRLAKQKIEYILSGNKEELYEPHFTFQGFRYVLIEEYPGTPVSKNFLAVVLHSEMDQIGFFKCSNKLVNKLHNNILWGMKGNFLDIPSDCPQRDERMGWTGDAQVFAGTASYLKQTAPFFRKWLRDLKSEQLDNGGIPHVIPNILTNASQQTNGEEHLKSTHSATGWADAAVICPWEIYKTFGDKR
ncbi:MAG: family 78 glycoside hydrolase catalytic domain, partial [Spirochaetales bacterium]|nr:family 78 glycoside hydrolase catalytic domain [Spirochaetales bacterium]